MLLISAILTGVAVGSMYGLIALGYHVTYVVSNTVNFSQGSSMMLGAVLGYTFAIRLGWPLPLAVAMALLLCALFGLVVERFLVRPFAERGSNGWLMATVAGGIVLDNIVLFTFGKEPRAFPSILAQKPICSSVPACFRCSWSFRWSGLVSRLRCRLHSIVRRLATPCSPSCRTRMPRA